MHDEIPDSVDSKVFVSTKELLIRFRRGEVKLEHIQLTIEDDASQLSKASDSVEKLEVTVIVV